MRENITIFVSALWMTASTPMRYPNPRKSFRMRFLSRRWRNNIFKETWFSNISPEMPAWIAICPDRAWAYSSTQAGDSWCPSQKPDCMSIQFRFPSIDFITNRIKILLKTGEHKLIKMTSDKNGEIQLISVTFSPQVWFAGQIAIDVQDTLC